jgi:hypothetical protein
MSLAVLNQRFLMLSVLARTWRPYLSTIVNLSEGNAAIHLRQNTNNEVVDRLIAFFNQT